MVNIKVYMWAVQNVTIVHISTVCTHAEVLMNTRHVLSTHIDMLMHKYM